MRICTICPRMLVMAGLAALLMVLCVAPVLADAVLTLDKKVTTGSGSCATAGESVTVDARTSVLFCYTIRNTGTAPATNLQLIEDNGTPGDPSDDFSVPLGGIAAQLLPFMTASVLYEHVVEQPGTFDYSATLSAVNEGESGGALSVSDSATVVANPVNASIDLTKGIGVCPSSTTSLSAEAGTELTFCYVFTNVGKAALLNLTLAEDTGTPGNPSDDIVIPLGVHASRLEPNFTIVLTHKLTLVPPYLGPVPYTVTLHGTNDGTSGGTVTETATVTITWSDTISPAFVTCPGDIVLDNEWGVLGATGTWPAPIVTDSSGMTPTITASTPFGSIFPLGTTPVTLTATDAAGNTATCAFDLTVEYTTSPRIEIAFPRHRDPVRIGQIVSPSFDVQTTAVEARVETTATSDGRLDTFEPGCHEFTVHAADALGLSSSKTTTYCVVYQMGPLGDPADWPADWLPIEQPLPLSDRMVVGSMPLGGRFVVGEEIGIFFTLRDAFGAERTEGRVHLSITDVQDPTD